MNESTLGTAVVIVSQWIELAVASGLVFAMLVQPRRERINYLFALYSGSIALWAFASLIEYIPQLRFGLTSADALHLSVTALALTAANFFLFVVTFTQSGGLLVRASKAAFPFALVAGLAAIWSGLAFTRIEIDGDVKVIDLSLAGYVLLAATVGYLALGLWMILDSQDERARFLRVPAAIQVVAYAGNLLPFLRTTPFDTTLAMVAAVWIGWKVLHFQVFQPLSELNRELRTANRDLQQVINDLAAEKVRAEELNRELKAVSQYKSDFLATMSHELRTPLNSILGYSDLLRGGIYGSLTEKQLDRLNRIHSNSHHLLNLINDILDLNKIEAGHFSLDVTQFQPGVIIDQALTDIEPMCAQKGLAFSLELPDELPPVYGDQNRVRQILDHLLDNAIKFTHQGEVTLRVSSLKVQNGQAADFRLPAIGWLQDGEWLVFSVTDTGIGIAPEHQARIFEEFSQLDASATRQYPGSGLGLAITKRLVEMHGGVIWIKSAPGEGSTFHVALPTAAKPHSQPLSTSPPTPLQTWRGENSGEGSI